MASSPPPAHPSAGLCLCKLCDCGKHRCGPAVLSTAGIPLEAVTEYKDRYPVHAPQYTGKIKPPAQTSTSTQPLAKVTESREQFAPKPLGPRMPPQKREYVPNAAPLDAVTGYASDYQRWNVPPAATVKKREVYTKAGVFEGVTTNKADFQAWNLPDRYRRPKQVYVPTDAKLDAASSYRADFIATGPATRPAPRTQELYTARAEDRTFVTTMKGAYHGEPGSRPPRRAAAEYVPSAAAFAGESTSHADYQRPPPSPPRTSCKPAAAAPAAVAFQGTSEYAAIYTPKDATHRSTRRPARAPYVAPHGVHFEGVSTMKADYVAAEGGTARRADFRPRNTYAPDADDRSFVSETRAMHDAKHPPVCRAVAVKAMVAPGGNVRRGKDGHVYLAAAGAAAAPDGPQM
ncbi:hypothetical protein GGF32_002561 [Allomyces javanicus]|nr:hypothetical protein GGF32_002561 [Allomyces javanicus]